MSDIHNLTIQQLEKEIILFINTYLVDIINYCSGIKLDYKYKKELQNILRDKPFLKYTHPCVREFLEHSKNNIKTIDKLYNIQITNKENIAIYLLSQTDKNKQLIKKNISIYLSLGEKQVNSIENEAYTISEEILNDIKNYDVKLDDITNGRYLGKECKTLCSCLVVIRNPDKFNNIIKNKVYYYIKNKTELHTIKPIKNFIDVIEDEEQQKNINYVLQNIYEELQKQTIDYKFNRKYWRDNVSKLEDRINVLNNLKIRKRYSRVLNNVKLLLDEKNNSAIAQKLTNITILFIRAIKEQNIEAIPSIYTLKRLYNIICNKLNNKYYNSTLREFVKHYNYLRRVKELDNFMQSRRIESIFHFTRLQNIESILDYGLFSRATLDSNNINYVYNDNLRIENNYKAICCSISFPNYQLFYKFRNIYNSDEWCVIELDVSSILWNDCKISKKNAATNCGNWICNLENGIDFETLFYEDGRKNLGIPDSYPTDPQAEILFLDTLDKKYIKGIYFDKTVDNKQRLSKLKKKYPFIDFAIKEELFQPRIDHKFWKKERENIDGV